MKTGHAKLVKTFKATAMSFKLRHDDGQAMAVSNAA